MKRIKNNIVLVLLSVFFFTSCEDAYNIIQDGELNESNAIQSVPDMQKYLNGIYASFTTSSEIAFTSIFTDECGIGIGSGGQNFDTHRFQLTAGNGFASSIWYTHHTVINRVNRLLFAVENYVTVPTEPTELETYNAILAQAKALRAFSYFELLTYFSTDLKNDNALGVVLFTDIPTIEETRPRNTNKECFTLIDSDLEFAYDNLTAAAVTNLNYKLISKPMVNALRARINLYRGNYPLAKQYAQDVISNSGVNLTLATPFNASTFYATNPTNPYRKMFADVTNFNGEVLFALDRPASQTWENIASNWTTNTTNKAGSPLFEVGRKLFNLLNTPGDVRRYANVDPSSVISATYSTDPDYFQKDVLVIDKYPGKTGYPLRNDVKIFRLSEMYFILAECYAREGNFNGATNSVASALKSVRDARSTTGPITLMNFSGLQDALQAILLERRLEFCFEGHRYIDLKRLGAEAGVSIDRDATDDVIVAPTTLSISDHRFTLPIPTSEINGNTGIQQNPEY